MNLEDPLAIKAKYEVCKKKGVTSNEKFFARMSKEEKDRINIVFEGDSWFAYPAQLFADRRFANVLYHIWCRFNGSEGVKANILNLSSVGDNAVDMFSPNSDDMDKLKAVFEETESIKFVLVSAGGNDVVGEHDPENGKLGLEPLLKEFQKGFKTEDCINKDKFKERLGSIKGAYENLIGLKKELLPNAKIITHTYDFMLPSGEPADFWPFKIGPWILPYMKDREIPENLRFGVIKYLLTEFKDMLNGLQKKCDGCFIAVDTQGTLTPDSELHWLNEIHPTEKGFGLIADKIIQNSPLISE